MRNSLLQEPGPEYQPPPRVSARLARLGIVNFPVQDTAYDNLPALVRDPAFLVRNPLVTASVRDRGPPSNYFW